MKEQKNKKIKLIIAIFILFILFIVFGIFVKSTPQSREDKVISYLKKKYKTDFEIIKLIDSGENVLFRGLHCDGSTFCPEIKEKGTYYYTYEVISTLDNITFKVRYLDRKLKDKISENVSYFSLKYTDEILNDIANNIVETIGNDETIVKCVNSEYEDCDYIDVIINDNFDEIYDTEYMAKLKKISSYINSKEKMDSDIDITVYINYKHNVQVWFEHTEPLIRKYSTEGNIIENYTLEEYIER